VASLAKQRRAIDQIIAIDTGSEDSSVRLLRGAGIATISTTKETGFGAAIKEALSNSKVNAVMSQMLNGSGLFMMIAPLMQTHLKSF